MTSPSERAASPVGRRSRFQQLTLGDRVWLKFAIGVPVFFHLVLVWIPAVITAVLSVMEWDNLQPVGDAKAVGLRNFWQIFTIFDPKLFPALFNNLILIVWLGLCSMVGMLFAYLLDKNIRGGRFYQSVYYMPVVLSVAVVGFIWKAVMFHPQQGLLNKLIPGRGHRLPRGQVHAVLVPAAVPRLQPGPFEELRSAADGHGLATCGLHHGAVPGRSQGRGSFAARSSFHRRLP